MAKRVVLAYSGGLDTSVAVGWLKAELGYEVIAVAVDVGQGGDFDALRERALSAGAVEAVVVDAREEMARDFLVPALAGQRALRRALPARLVALAPGHRPPPRGGRPPPRCVRGRARLHGQGQRPGPLRGGHARARARPRDRGARPRLGHDPRADDRLRRAARHRGARSRADRIYSIDENLWGRAIECGVLEDPWEAPPDDVFALTRADGDGAGRGHDRLRSRRARQPRRRATRPRRADRAGSGVSPARSATGGSTSSRTAGSASRAGRSTSARPRSPSSPRTRTSRA